MILLFPYAMFPHSSWFAAERLVCWSRRIGPTLRVVDDASPCQGVAVGMAVQLHVLVDEGEGPGQAAPVDAARVLPA